MNESLYTSVVGTKFQPDGSAREFPGNTIICFINPDTPAYQHGLWIQNQIQQEVFGPKFSLLPPSSFHMTVFELLCDQVRKADFWSTNLPLDAPLDVSDAFFTQKVSTVPVPDNFQMTYWKLKISGDGIGIYLKPSDANTRESLEQYRDAISNAVGVRFSNHDDYTFHISLAYRIMHLTDSEEALLQQFAERVDERLTEAFGIINTGNPMLVFFDDMLNFVTADQRHVLRTRK